MSVDLADVMIIMLFGALLFAAGFWVAYVMLRPLMRQQATRSSLADLLALTATRSSSVRMADDPEVPEGEPEETPLPVDPDNPPFPRTYHRRAGRPAKFCHCHGRELQDGEEVLFWPNPEEEGAFWLVCAPATQEASVL